MSSPHDTPPQQASDGVGTGMPKWVKVQIVLIAIFVLGVIVFSVVYSVGDYGPGKHTPRGSDLHLEVGPSGGDAVDRFQALTMRGAPSPSRE